MGAAKAHAGDHRARQFNNFVYASIRQVASEASRAIVGKPKTAISVDGQPIGQSFALQDFGEQPAIVKTGAIRSKVMDKIWLSSMSAVCSSK